MGGRETRRSGRGGTLSHHRRVLSPRARKSHPGRGSQTPEGPDPALRCRTWSRRPLYDSIRRSGPAPFDAGTDFATVRIPDRHTRKRSDSVGDGGRKWSVVSGQWSVGEVRDSVSGRPSVGARGVRGTLVACPRVARDGHPDTLSSASGRISLRSKTFCKSSLKNDGDTVDRQPTRRRP